MNIARDEGKACLHPFNAFPYEYYEGNPKIGRARSLELCCKAIDICDEFWIFGVSEGTLFEADYFFKRNEENGLVLPVSNLIRQYDPEYKKYSDIYRDRFERTLKILELI